MKKSRQASFHTALLFALLAGLAATPNVGRADEADVTDTQYTWDLTDFYASKAEWVSALERLRGELVVRVRALLFAGRVDEAREVEKPVLRRFARQRE